MSLQLDTCSNFKILFSAEKVIHLVSFLKKGKIADVVSIQGNEDAQERRDKATTVLDKLFSIVMRDFIDDEIR